MVYATSLTLTIVSPTRIDLHWIEVGGPSTIAQVERSPDSATWAPLGLVYYGLATFADTTCSPETSYWYRIRLYEPSAGWGPYCLPECGVTTALLDTTACTDVVTPSETFAAVLTQNDPAVFGLSPSDAIVPTEILVKVHVPGGSTLHPVAKDRVWPVEIFTYGFLRTLALSDHPTPGEIFPTAPVTHHAKSKALADVVYPDDLEITSHLWSNDTNAGTDILLVGRSDNRLYLFTTSNPVGYWTSRDIDFGLPGAEKTLTEIVFWGVPLAPLTVTVSVSLDGGDTWAWSEVVTLDRARSGIAYPWLTGEQFRVRFGAAGLQLSGFQLNAKPRSREAPRP